MESASQRETRRHKGMGEEEGDEWRETVCVQDVEREREKREPKRNKRKRRDERRCRDGEDSVSKDEGIKKYVESVGR